MRGINLWSSRAGALLEDRHGTAAEVALAFGTCSLAPGQKDKNSFLGQGLKGQQMLLGLICNLPQDNEDTCREAVAGSFTPAG